MIYLKCFGHTHLRSVTNIICFTSMYATAVSRSSVTESSRNPDF